MRILSILLALLAMVMLAGCPDKDVDKGQKPKPDTTPKVAPTPTETPKVAPTPTVTPKVTPTPTETPKVTPTPTVTPKVTPTPTATPKVTPTPAPAGKLIEAEKFKVTAATVKDYPKASGGKAVLFDKDNSKIETTVELAPGKYDVVITAMAPDGDHDAVDVDVAGVDPKAGVKGTRDRVFFDKEYNAFVPGSVKVEVALTEKAQVKVTIAVDDEMDMAIDKVEFVPIK